MQGGELGRSYVGDVTAIGSYRTEEGEGRILVGSGGCLTCYHAQTGCVLFTEQVFRSGIRIHGVVTSTRCKMVVVYGERYLKVGWTIVLHRTLAPLQTSKANLYLFEFALRSSTSGRSRLTLLLSWALSVTGFPTSSSFQDRCNCQLV